MSELGTDPVRLIAAVVVLIVVGIIALKLAIAGIVIWLGSVFALAASGSRALAFFAAVIGGVIALGIGYGLWLAFQGVAGWALS